MKSIRKYFSLVLETLDKPVRLFITSFVFVAAFSVNSFATQPKIVEGTLALIRAATGWLTLIIGAGSGLYLGFLAISKGMTDDQGVIAEKNKLMKNTVKSAVIAVSATGLITLILGFYQ